MSFARKASSEDNSSSIGQAESDDRDIIHPREALQPGAEDDTADTSRPEYRNDDGHNGPVPETVLEGDMMCKWYCAAAGFGPPSDCGGRSSSRTIINPT